MNRYRGNGDGRPFCRTRVKICGITRPEDAEAAVCLGADGVGVVFARSPRNVTIQQAKEVLDAAPNYVNRVGVFADQDGSFIWDAVLGCRLDWVQLSGSEPPELPEGLPARVMKTVHVAAAEDLEALAGYPGDAFLLDSPPLPSGRMGGTGRTFDWDLARSLPWPRERVVVAGGLSDENVGEVIRLLRPGGVDVSSGVESRPGVKDPERLRAFFRAVERADGEVRERTEREAPGEAGRDEQQGLEEMT
ncbi:MAG: phosphoribosylanthranilate isomerase [bacterium]